MAGMTKEDLVGIIDERFEQKFLDHKDEAQRKYAGIYLGAREEEAKKGINGLPADGTRFARLAKSLMAVNGDVGKIEAEAARMYPEDRELAAYAKAMSVTTPTDGGYMVPEVLLNEVIPFLYNQLVIKQLGARVIPMPNGNMRIPRFDATSVATYIGESKAAPKTQPTIGNVAFSGKKLAAMVPFSNDLIRSSSMAADGFVRDDLIRVMQIKMDTAALYGAGTAFSPSGLDTLLTSDEKLGSNSTTFTADRPIEILQELWAKNIPMVSVGWAFSGRIAGWIANLKTTTGAYIYRDEMSKGTLLGYPWKLTNIARYTAGSPGYGDIFFGDWNELIWADQLTMELTASREASYVDDLGNTVSAFQNDQTVLRAISIHDFNVRHRQAFVEATYKLSLT